MKKYIVLIMCVLCALALFSCGTGNTPNGQQSSTGDSVASGGQDTTQGTDSSSAPPLGNNSVDSAVSGSTGASDSFNSVPDTGFSDLIDTPPVDSSVKEEPKDEAESSVSPVNPDIKDEETEKSEASESKPDIPPEDNTDTPPEDNTDTPPEDNTDTPPKDNTGNFKDPDDGNTTEEITPDF